MRTGGSVRPQPLLVVLLALVVVLPGCLNGGGAASFSEVAEKSGISYVIDARIPYQTRAIAFLGGGVAVGDVNQDGWPDFYVADGGPNALFINDGDGTFTERTRAWNAMDPRPGRAPVLFDYDNDGDLDLFIGNFVTRSRLLRNDGGRFTDVTQEAGIDLVEPVMTATAADFDGDGALDLFTGIYGDYIGDPPDRMTGAEDGAANHLFRNQGDGTFVDVGEEVGLNYTRWALASSSVDYDLDRDPDLYIANDFGWDSFFVNEDGRLVDRGRQLDAVVNRNGMGVEWFDFDGDGDLDVYTTNIFIPGSKLPVYDGNALLRNDGDTFTDVSFETGTANGLWGWDAEAVDYDNDGDLDLYTANGFHSRSDWDVHYDGERVIERSENASVGSAAYGPGESRYNDTHVVSIHPDSIPNWVKRSNISRAMAKISQGSYQVDRFFVNDGSGSFEDRAEELGLGVVADARGVASIDHDQDGDMDLIVTAARDNVRLYRNDGGNENHWLQVDLEAGEGRWAEAHGAWVEATVGDRVHVVPIESASGFISQSQPIAQIGLGNATQVDRVEVHWPWGGTSERTDVEADQRIVVGPE